MASLYRCSWHRPKSLVPKKLTVIILATEVLTKVYHLALEEIWNKRSINSILENNTFLHITDSAQIFLGVLSRIFTRRTNCQILYSKRICDRYAAAAKSLQSCPILCDPIDSSPCPWDSPGKNTGVGCHFLLQCMKVKSESEVTQSCPTLSDPMDCSLPVSSIHGIFQARVLEWVAMAFSVWQVYCSGKERSFIRNFQFKVDSEIEVIILRSCQSTENRRKISIYTMEVKRKSGKYQGHERDFLSLASVLWENCIYVWIEIKGRS